MSRRPLIPRPEREAEIARLAAEQAADDGRAGAAEPIPEPIAPSVPPSGHDYLHGDGLAVTIEVIVLTADDAVEGVAYRWTDGAILVETADGSTVEIDNDAITEIDLGFIAVRHDDGARAAIAAATHRQNPRSQLRHGPSPLASARRPSGPRPLPRTELPPKPPLCLDAF